MSKIVRISALSILALLIASSPSFAFLETPGLQKIIENGKLKMVGGTPVQAGSQESENVTGKCDDYSGEYVFMGCDNGGPAGGDNQVVKVYQLKCEDLVLVAFTKSDPGLEVYAGSEKYNSNVVINTKQQVEGNTLDSTITTKFEEKQISIHQDLSYGGESATLHYTVSQNEKKDFFVKFDIGQTLMTCSYTRQ